MAGVKRNVFVQVLDRLLEQVIPPSIAILSLSPLALALSQAWCHLVVILAVNRIAPANNLKKEINNRCNKITWYSVTVLTVL